MLALQEGLTLEAAKQRADAEMSGATRIMIETVLVMYDDLANRTIRLSREILRRKAEEKALRQTQLQLLQAKEQAEAASQAKSDFLAGFSHEIRTSITTISGALHLLQRDQLQEKELCRQAGMSAILGKPIDPRRLFDCLFYWLRLGAALANSPQTTEKPA